MIYDKDDFEVKYWGGDYVAFNEEFEAEKKPRRSFKKKIIISSLFVLLIAITPLILFGISNIDFKSSKNVAVVVDETPKKTVNQNTVEYKPSVTPKKTDIQTVEVVNNDSYWKIAKRTCGTGKNYLSVRDQNNAKALHIGDTVIVNCSL